MLRRAGAAACATAAARMLPARVGSCPAASSAAMRGLIGLGTTADFMTEETRKAAEAVDAARAAVRRPRPVELPPHPAVATASDAAAALRTMVKFDEPVMSPLAFRDLQIIDIHTLEIASRMTDVLTLAYLCPINQLSHLVHPRFEVEAFGTCEKTGEQLGLLVMTCGRRHPQPHEGNFLFKKLASVPHGALSFTTIVIDRSHWRRTHWNLGAFNGNLWWGKAVKRTFGLTNLETGDNVEIDASLNQEGSVGSGKYSCRIGSRLSIDATETTGSLLDRDARTTPCFADNESALGVLALPREALSFAHGGGVLRQPMWTPLVDPQLAGNVNVTVSDDLETTAMLEAMIGGPLPLGRPPVAAWLVDAVDDVLMFEAEMDIEIENDPAVALTAHQQNGQNVRIASGLTRRARAFRDDVRSQSYGMRPGEQATGG